MHYWKKIGNEFIFWHWPMFQYEEESVSIVKRHYPDEFICISVAAVRVASPSLRGWWWSWLTTPSLHSDNETRLVHLSSPCRSICWANSYFVLCGCLQQWSWNYIAVLKEGKPISHIYQENSWHQFWLPLDFMVLKAIHNLYNLYMNIYKHIHLHIYSHIYIYI